MNTSLNINASAVVRFTNKLEKMSRSVLPSAIRGALNKAAFNVKQDTMLKSSAKHFKNRHKNFFKANSHVAMAKGFNVSSMRATVGFVSTKLQYNYKSIRELEQQEFGGTIGDRSLIPLDSARSGNDYNKPVLPRFRLNRISNVIDSDKSKGANRKTKFMRAVGKAGVGGFVKGNLGRRTLFKIDAIKRVGGKTIVNKTPLYSYASGRKISIKPTGFMRSASKQTATRIEKYFIQEAEFRIAKALK